GSRLRYSQAVVLHILLNQNRSSYFSPLLRLLSGRSPIRGQRAVVRETGGHQLLEIWDCNGLRKCLNLTALNKHGRVYDDAQFGCLSWSECENKLLYVAERSKNTSIGKHESANGKVFCAHTHTNMMEMMTVYCEDWGEALTNKSSPVICVVNLQSGTVAVLQGVLPDISPGQALWAPGSQSVLFVGWCHEPFRLGLKFCSNRRLDAAGCLSGYDLSVSCPRLSPDGSTLIYLQGQVFGPHNQCLSLQMVHTLSLSLSLSLSSGCLYFCVLFLLTRVKQWLLTLHSLSDVPRVYGSWKLLTVQRDLMVVCCSSPNTPPTLRVGFLPSAGEAVTWRTLQQPVLTFDFHWTILDISPPPEEENTDYSALDFGAVLVKPTHPVHDASLPLVVFIHGGPHSQFPAEWNATTAGLAKLGFAVLMVNYRGSTGFGQDSILSLIGQIGSQDVKDVQRAVLTALQSDLTLDSKRLAVIGGSHGGFLSCHLVGQYPDFYRACAARNPVINAATLLGTSDIVDWRYTSVGLQYSYDRIPTAEALAVMLEKSPITHAAQIKAPVLLMLGGRDRRVSPHQGLELYKALKSRASPVRLLWFAEDGHSLSRVDTQADCFLNTVLWLHQHL
uniref:acylaminoacyl-peptidase n=1 Tax=Scophthalmus maximus TaxID=52904 RepID=A0A8D3D8Y3_SCOMX